MIVSTYLTTSIDPQRGEVKKKDDPEYILEWYDSIVNLGLNGVLIHDGLSKSFVKCFPKIEFRKVRPVPEKMQLYDYRWVLYFEFMLNIACDAVFFTDVSDVQVKRNPFYEFDEGKLYCGDEREMIKDSLWMRESLKNEWYLSLKGFENMINSDLPLLNAGILGGSRDIVFKFLMTFVRYIEIFHRRPVDKTVDMPLFNYVMYRYFNPVHGYPVNSLFKAYEKRNDVWFIHK